MNSASRLAVVVCVHNALEYARICVDSVLCHTAGTFDLILVDDGSELPTARWLASLEERYPHVQVLTHDHCRGYTCAANTGLRRSVAEYTVLLNSDTIVSPGWADRLIACADSDASIGIVGPLSNAATYQSVPVHIDAAGGWCQNELAPGVTVSAYAERVAGCSQGLRPRVPVVNGFCFLIKRAVIDVIGLLDEESFPRGYGEENDYCVRAAGAGFGLAVADDAYVYHAVSRSFGGAGRDALVARAHEVLRQKYPAEVFDTIDRELRGHADLDRVRAAVAEAESAARGAAGRAAAACNRAISVLFLLPDCAPEAGGTQVIHETAVGLRAMGIECRIAARQSMRAAYRAFFDQGQDLFFYYEDVEELFAFARSFRVAIATIFHSTELLEEIVRRQPEVLPAYFVQDYEPWFVEPGTPQRKQAERSYELIPGCQLLALSPWVCEVLEEKHGVSVHKIWGSLDTGTFYPDFDRRARGGLADSEPFIVTAMIRPSTPWRGAARTLRLLAAAKERFGDRLQVEVFGAGPAEIAAVTDAPDFDFVAHGTLGRGAVATLLRRASIFVDFSDFQAFGRTALEAMACGCAVIAPRSGGVGDFGIAGENILLVDSEDEDACQRALSSLIEDRALCSTLGGRGARTGAEYSVHRSALSVVDVLAEAVGKQLQAR